MKISLARKGKCRGPMPEEQKQKIGQSNLGTKRPDLSEYNKRRTGIFKHKLESILKMTKSRTGLRHRPRSNEAKKNIKLAQQKRRLREKELTTISQPLDI